MPESPSPAPSVLLPTHCACPRCKARRQELEDASACPCPECQPGPGIDWGRSWGALKAANRARLTYLLSLKRSLTAEEEEELDGLCHSYLYGS